MDIKTHLSLLIAAACISCTMETEPVGICGDLAEMTFQATNMEFGKSILSGNDISWEKGDEIAVYDGVAQRCFTATNSGQPAEFTGMAIPGNNFSFVYPHNGQHIDNYDGMSLYLPESQKPLKDGFDPRACLMAARSHSHNVNMKNICGMLRVNIKSNDVSSVRISSLNGSCFAGNFSCGFDIMGNPSVSGGDASSIVITPANGNVFEPGSYYIVLLPGTISGGLQLKVILTDGILRYRNTSNTLTIERAKYTDVPVAIESGNFSEIDVESLNDEALKIDMNHPYLFSDKADFASHIAAVKGNKSVPLTLMHNEVIAASGRIVQSGKVMEHKLDSSHKMLSRCRDAFGRIFFCAYAFRFTGEQKYLTCAEELINQICDFPDWNKDNHYLDTATLLQAAAVGYDWLYDYLSPSTIAKLETTAFKYCMTSCLKDAASYLNYQNTWNQTVTSAFIMGATAFYKINPSLCSSILKTSIKSSYDGIRFKYGCDGSYPSGTMYWRNGVDMIMLAHSAVKSVYGADFGIMDYSGLKRTPEWYLSMCGNTGSTFSFGDTDLNMPYVATMFYFSALYSNPDYAYFEVQSAKSGKVQSGGVLSQTADVVERTYPLEVLWCSKVDDLDANVPEAKLFCAIEDRQNTVSWRSGWGKNDIYFAVKAGQGRISHGHMDTGSICYDKDGGRWCADAPQDSYTPIETRIAELHCGSLWNFDKGSARWQAFSISPRQHCTFTVNDTDHNPDGGAFISDIVDTQNEKGAVVDFNDTFVGELESALREAVICDGEYLRIRDIITTLPDKDAHIRWNFCSKATAMVMYDLSGILLSSQGKQMVISVESPPYPVTYSKFTNDPTLVDYPAPFCDVEELRTNYNYSGFTIDIPRDKTVTITTIIKNKNQ